MMSRSKCFFLVFGTICGCIFFFSTCKNPSNSIDLSKVNATSIFDFFSDVSIVPLETSDECLVADVSDIQYHNKHFYLLDSRTQQLFCFDDQGEFKFKIANQGKGPEEYNYITDFSINPTNDLLLLMDPVLQFVHFYSSLNGAYRRTLRIKTDRVMGLNKAFTLNDSVLVVSSITNYQLLFVDMETGKVLHKIFPYPTKETHLQAFSSGALIYPFEGGIHTMLSLSQKIVKVEDFATRVHFKWCFGRHNNSAKQVQSLVEDIDAGNKYTLPYEGVGIGKPLNHHFIYIFETRKYHLSILEFEDDFVHVLYDKENDKSNVFKTFTEGISLYGFFFTAGRAIGVERGIASYFKQNFPVLSRRSYTYFQPGVLSERDRKIAEKHDPLIDNPFLVVYKFRE